MEKAELTGEGLYAILCKACIVSPGQIAEAWQSSCYMEKLNRFLKGAVYMATPCFYFWITKIPDSVPDYRGLLL